MNTKNYIKTNIDNKKEKSVRWVIYKPDNALQVLKVEYDMRDIKRERDLIPFIFLTHQSKNVLLYLGLKNLQYMMY